MKGVLVGEGSAQIRVVCEVAEAKWEALQQRDEPLLYKHSDRVHYINRSDEDGEANSARLPVVRDKA